MADDDAGTIEGCTRWAVVNRTTGRPVWRGRWDTEDGAKQHLRRLQRSFNRAGYDEQSENLSVAQVADDG